MIIFPLYLPFRYSRKNAITIAKSQELTVWPLHFVLTVSITLLSLIPRQSDTSSSSYSSKPSSTFFRTTFSLFLHLIYAFSHFLDFRFHSKATSSQIFAVHSYALLLDVCVLYCVEVINFSVMPKLKNSTDIPSGMATVPVDVFFLVLSVSYLYTKQLIQFKKLR